MTDLTLLRQRFERASAMIRRGAVFGHVDRDYAQEAVRVAELALQAAEESQGVVDQTIVAVEECRRVVHTAKGTPAQVKAEWGRLAREDRDPS